VLTSKDPNYQTKVDGIVRILTELKDDEAFFSIDEFGPFAVKKRGASGWVRKKPIRCLNGRSRRAP
jgi:hypothetical protein